ncbi:MAG: type I-E CRISPR-associated endoribonuclease Cas2e [Lactobacillus sp.]|jgi:CRISPR-associated protein Cas2|nr:type I-E CRISPR-associated endoribonuclease Cas2e [Lactobacillus sp.]MCI2032103.1 type I-E CRISPR-associated endoribonuclease Cas2e [Lactobacillus sp.]
MIVITLTKVPPSLRGDLTKWYQEVQTGVYVGNVSARIRDKVWARIQRDIGSGQATMVYNAKNELGYQFKTTRQDHEVVDFDGIPLMKHLIATKAPMKPGFSNAAHYHRARMSARPTKVSTAKAVQDETFIALDIETTGLDVTKEQIIAIGAVQYAGGKPDSSFYRLIRTAQPLPEGIQTLTGITTEALRREGVPLAEALVALKQFVRAQPIVGYHVSFDEKFIANGFRQVGEVGLANRFIDLMPIVKRTDKFLDSYRLTTVLKKYAIVNRQPHNALADAEATAKLAMKLIKNGRLVIAKG